MFLYVCAAGALGESALGESARFAEATHTYTHTYTHTHARTHARTHALHTHYTHITHTSMRKLAFIHEGMHVASRRA
jgi:hypothetical protein